MLAVSAYVFVYRAIDAPEEYIGFVVVGGAMTAFWLNVLWSMSSQLYWEKEQGNLALYIMVPNSMMAILLGMALGGMLMTALRAAAILILGSWLFNVEYQVASFWLLFAVFLLTMVALYGMGMMSASLFLLLSREAWHLANLAQEPVYLVSGFYFPISSFSFWVAAAASIIPLTLGLDAMRQLVFPAGATLGFLIVQVEIMLLLVTRQEAQKPGRQGLVSGDLSAWLPGWAGRSNRTGPIPSCSPFTPSLNRSLLPQSW
jgi:ABC-2 type transport system permease protein